MAAPYGISPSALARYFFHDCERFIRFRSTRSPKKHGVPQRRYDSGPVMEAVLASGLTWEENVVTKYLADRVRIAPGDGAPVDRTWTVEESVKQLDSASPGEFLYQPTLRPPSSLYSDVGLLSDAIDINDNRPDLIEVRTDSQGERVFRVIDIKRGAAVRLPYRIQVLFYALELQHVLAEAGVEGIVDVETGAAWLGGSSEAEAFDMTPVEPHLRDLLAQLPAVMSKPLEDVGWHVRFRCEWCEYLGYCRSEMTSKNNVSRLAGLTVYGKRYLSKDLGINTLPDLDGLLRSDGGASTDQLSKCASLAGEGPRLEARVAAYSSHAPRSFHSIHPALPIGENVALFLTVQSEPVEDRTWLLGLLVHARDELRQSLFGEQGKPHPFVVIARNRDECPLVVERFVNRLYEVLRRVDLWNTQRPLWKDQLSLQLYCYGEKEREQLVRVLLQAAENPALADKAMALLFHLQAPDLIQVDDHPRDVLPYPIVALVSAVGRLLALPVDVAYTLPETLEALSSSFTYRRRDNFHFPFGHGLRSDDVVRHWNGEDVDLRPIVSEAARRLFAYRAVLWEVRKVAADQLVAWPPKHRLIDTAGFQHSRLSRLAFLARYESVMACLAVRSARCESREILAAKGHLVPLVYEGAGRFRVDASGVVLEASGFTRWLLVRDTTDGARAQARFNDWLHRERFWGGRADKDVGIGWLSAVAEDELGFAETIRARWDRPHDPELEVGARVLLMPRYLDFNGSKVIDGLRQLDGGRGLFVRLLDDPATATAVPELPVAVRDHLDPLVSSFDLTPSQESAWHTIVDSRTTVVWGPPGTGKTHFLASLVVGLCEAHRRAGSDFRVLVTAMTHTAIENVMRKLAERARKSGCREPATAKIGDWKSAAPFGGEQIDKKNLDAWLDDHAISVVGSTVWGLSKSRSDFDLVLIDEASQMKVPDAALAIGRVRPEGRLVAAGDHHQLGPILAGTYPDPAPPEPVLHDSVFTLLRERPGRTGAPLCQLLENWRMCDVLTGASRVLYGPAFTYASSSVGQRRLTLSTTGDDLVDQCLEPRFPLVFVVIDGVRATKLNEVEARLVAKLATALRDTVAEAEDDEAFWRDHLFVVSPHHAQIRAIRSALAGERAWAARPFVDTVDKMQGQEADAVLISYGVADPEYAAMEAEFIYSRNRLNVSITRARAKSIVFVPKPLLEATPEVLDVPAAAEGLGYMRGLVQLSRRHGTTARFTLGDGVSAEIVRLGVEL